MNTAPPRCVGGIFVGGGARRLGGIPKGRLAAPGGPSIVVRTRSMLEATGIPCVLVGSHPAYADLGMTALADDPPGIGPLGGLAALLSFAGPGAHAIAVACDMPLLSDGLLRRLLGAPDDAPAVAFRREGRWEPLFARYDAGRVLSVVRERIGRGELALQGLLDRVGALGLAVEEAEAGGLLDWDEERDLPPGTRLA